MNRLDFSSVIAVIRYYISPDHGMNQPNMLSAKQAELRMLYEQVGTYIAPSMLQIA